MRRLLALSCSAFAFVGLAVAGSGCAPGNQEACIKYVEAQNAAYSECGMDDRVIRDGDVEQTCPATLNEGLNCVDYYERLAASFACENGEVVWDSSGSCS
jgi:hypothetical protein